MRSKQRRFLRINYASLVLFCIFVRIFGFNCESCSRKVTSHGWSRLPFTPLGASLHTEETSRTKTNDKHATYQAIPNHVAYIVDGNGRWATAQGLPRQMGHLKGAENTPGIVQATFEQGVRVVTLFLLSTENWSRPAAEVSHILQLLEGQLRQLRDILERQRVQVRVIGQTDRLPVSLQQLLDSVGYRPAGEETEEEAKVLCLALSYGGRADVVQAVHRILSDAQKSNSSSGAAEAFSEERLREHTALGRLKLPDPDLLVRSGGACRLSNFLLFNLAYTELLFTHTLWPDLTREDVRGFLEEFAQRQRRFGGLPSGSSAGSVPE